MASNKQSSLTLCLKFSNPSCLPLDEVTTLHDTAKGLPTFLAYVIDNGLEERSESHVQR